MTNQEKSCYRNIAHHLSMVTDAHSLFAQGRIAGLVEALGDQVPDEEKDVVLGGLEAIRKQLAEHQESSNAKHVLYVVNRKIGRIKSGVSGKDVSPHHITTENDERGGYIGLMRNRPAGVHL